MKTLSLKSLIASLAVLATLTTACSPPAPLAKKSPDVSGRSTPTPDRPTPQQSQAPTPTKIVGDEIENLALEIAGRIPSEKAKAKAIYEWVAKNITYDIQAYVTNDLPNPAPLNVLATRSGVCEGYARLYVALARASGLEAEMLAGYSKGFSPDENQDRSEPDHAWCAVKFDGVWHLLDPTWAAGHIDENKKFVAKYSESWFDTPAEQFVYTHLPEKSDWQLLSTPVSTEEFWMRPTVTQLYFDYGLGIPDPNNGTLAIEGSSKIVITTQQDCHLMAAVYQDSRRIEENYTLVERQGRESTVSFSTPGRGQYRLMIFAGDPKSEKAESALVFEVKSSAQGPVFPNTSKAFADEQVRLISPRSSVAAGKETEIVLHAPGATALMAVIGEEQIPFEKSGEQFSLKLAPSGDQVNVFGNYDGGSQYRGLVDIPVD